MVNDKWNELFSALPALLKEIGRQRKRCAKPSFLPPGDELRAKVCANTRSVWLYQKHLIVAVGSETWKKHLEDLSGQMIFKLNSVLGRRR